MLAMLQNFIVLYHPKFYSLSCTEYVKPNIFFNFFSKQFYLYPLEEQFLPNEINVIDDLDRDFEPEELDTVTGKLSLGKAAGSDGIPNEARKCMSAEHKGILLDTLNKCWNTLSFPEHWSNVIICPIYKKGDAYKQ
jgi:hypothetical protein